MSIPHPRDVYLIALGWRSVVVRTTEQCFFHPVDIGLSPGIRLGQWGVTGHDVSGSFTCTDFGLSLSLSSDLSREEHARGSRWPKGKGNMHEADLTPTCRPERWPS